MLGCSWFCWEVDIRGEIIGFLLVFLYFLACFVCVSFVKMDIQLRRVGIGFLKLFVRGFWSLVAGAAAEGVVDM